MRKSKKGLYRINTVDEAKLIATDYLTKLDLITVINFGLPEIDDRFDIWRVPILDIQNNKIGEVVIDAITTLVDTEKSTKKELLENRLLGRKESRGGNKKKEDVPKISVLRNTIGLGDSEILLKQLPSESIDLIFTSPPYFNAKPEYQEYLSYEEYLLKMKNILHECHRVLNEGRFFVINLSPVLLRRASRSEASKRIAVPFDFHRLFIEEDYEFIDDIIWEKPEGAGWATGRGRRFAADRNPLQYKPVPVTEYILVYRKKTDKLIDWLIRKNPNQNNVKASKISGEYDVTNIWKITPAHSKVHPAVFPQNLAEKVIRYYSFVNDVVLDPFAGIGTTAKASVALKRRFVAFEFSKKYVDVIKNTFLNTSTGYGLDIDWLDVNDTERTLVSTDNV